MVKAIIFDMDGVLLDSEPYWHEAEKVAFAEYNITLTTEDCLLTMGMRVDEVVQFWINRGRVKQAVKSDLAELILVKVCEIIIKKGTPLVGVIEALEYCKKSPYKIGLATSSPEVVINAVMKALKIEDYFEVLYSAEHEEYGKPHPAVYMTAAKKLGVLPAECIAVEDTITGMTSAKAASMKCLAIPNHLQAKSLKFALADLKADTLLDFEQNIALIVDNY